MKAISFAVPLLAAGMVFAQAPSKTAPPSSQENNPQTMNQHNRRNWLLHRLTANLNLTSEQQTKIHDIFQKARVETKAIQPQLRAERQEVMSAIRSDQTAQITKVIDQNAQVNAKAAAIHARSLAEVRAVLSASQQVKFDQNLHALMHRPMRPGANHTEGQTQG